MTEEHQTRLFDFLFNQHNINWQTMLYDLVEQEQMDVWDIEISKIANKYVQMIKSLKDLNFHVCGKILLAAAILLKMKSDHLLGEEINKFDLLFSQQSEDAEWSALENFFEQAGEGLREDLEQLRKQRPLVVPRAPQPRKRKVSIYDLIDALEKALESNIRKPVRLPRQPFKVPERKVDISIVIKDLYAKVIEYFNQEEQKQVMFSNLLPSDATSLDKIYTFIPLLHLTNERKVDLEQEEHFADIQIKLLSQNKEPPNKASQSQ